MLKDTGPAGHDGEVPPLVKASGELGKVKPIRAGPAMLLEIVDRRRFGQEVRLLQRIDKGLDLELHVEPAPSELALSRSSCRYVFASL